MNIHISDSLSSFSPHTQSYADVSARIDPAAQRPASLSKAKPAETLQARTLKALIKQSRDLEAQLNLLVQSTMDHDFLVSKLEFEHYFLYIYCNFHYSTYFY